jgi:SAM-dependent methyltransferase
MKRRPAKRLLEALSVVAPGMQPAMQRLFIRVGYAVVNRWLDKTQAGCMNYGYAALDADTPAEVIDADSYGRRLYEHVAGAASLENREVLEVGCGRGGGGAYVAERFDVSTLTGLDFSQSAITFARAHHADPRLRFVRGDAENLPFPDALFDAVLNVESSHCYPNLPRFTSEVFRVLRPGGHSLFADLRLSQDVKTMREAILDAGFVLAEEERITPNVVRALELDSPRRIEFVRGHVPRPLQSYVLNFAAANNSQVYGALRDGDLEYMRLAVVKPGR